MRFTRYTAGTELPITLARQDARPDGAIRRQSDDVLGAVPTGNWAELYVYQY
jgi:hypothetical protein